MVVDGQLAIRISKWLLFLFATQTTASGVVLYHIPTYLFLELPGEKKPNLKLCPEETKVCPSEIDCTGVRKSTVVQRYDIENKWMRKNRGLTW